MFSNDLFLCFCVVIMNGMDRMDGMDSDEVNEVAGYSEVAPNTQTEKQRKYNAIVPK